jgi:hypothetical protein
MIQRVGKYQDHLHAEVPGDIRVGEHGYKYRLVEGMVMPPYVTPQRFKLARTIETRPEDVCYTSYPKSGSSWLANVLYLLLHEGQTPRERTLRGYLHWLESSWPFPCERSSVDATPSPRIFKSHMPYQMAVAGGPEHSPCKFVYIARNPKDVAVAYYFFESEKEWSGRYAGPWEHWLEMFLEGRVQRGDWFDHVLGWWRHRDLPNLLFLTYEDLLNDFDGTLDRLIRFIDRPCAPEIVERVRQRSTLDFQSRDGFSNHQEITQLEGFFRKGRIGSWKDVFTVAQSERFDRIYAERMAGSGLDFVFEAEA